MFLTDSDVVVHVRHVLRILVVKMGWDRVVGDVCDDGFQSLVLHELSLFLSAIFLDIRVGFVPLPLGLQIVVYVLFLYGKNKVKEKYRQ